MQNYNHIEDLPKFKPDQNDHITFTRLLDHIAFNRLLLLL